VADPLVVGYLSHLVADLLTSSGLRLAWPLRRRFAIPLCKTGSPGELVIVMSLVVWVGATILGMRPVVLLPLGGLCFNLGAAARDPTFNETEVTPAGVRAQLSGFG
jgi:inner membrane protein